MWTEGAPESGKGWVGVDLDGTLAYYDGWRGPGHIGDPIPRMLDRVRFWLEEGTDVRIFTARVAVASQADEARMAITQWCYTHFGRALPVTCEKDPQMIELWDDRAIRVESNTGRMVMSP